MYFSNGKMERPKRVFRTGGVRIFRIYPNRQKLFSVEVRIARTSRLMEADLARSKEWGASLKIQNGLVLSFHSKVGPAKRARSVVEPRMRVAQLFLSRSNVYRRQVKILSSQAAHAAMAWARLRKIDLQEARGEEVFCDSVGEMAQQLDRICRMEKIY